MTTTVPSKRGVRLLVAEDVRQEIGGKFSLLGLFAGEKILVAGEMPPGSPPNIAFVLPSLAFVFVITEGEGRFEGRFKFIAPDRKTVLSDSKIEQIQLRKGESNTVGSMAKPFVGPDFGAYTAELNIGKAKFKFPVEVLKAPTAKKK